MNKPEETTKGRRFKSRVASFVCTAVIYQNLKAVTLLMKNMEKLVNEDSGPDQCFHRLLDRGTKVDC